MNGYDAQHAPFICNLLHFVHKFLNGSFYLRLAKVIYVVVEMGISVKNFTKRKIKKKKFYHWYCVLAIEIDGPNVLPAFTQHR